MGETIVNTGLEGLLEILRCGLERSAEQRTAIQLGDRSQYVGMSDIGKMLDCPRAALPASSSFLSIGTRLELSNANCFYNAGTGLRRVSIRRLQDVGCLPCLSWKSSQT